MDTILMNVNWPAIIVGTIASFALGMIWFGQIFGKVWSAGSHNIQPPEKVPRLAMAVQLLGTFLMAWAIGVTAQIESLWLAVLFTFSIATLQFGGSLFSQKSQAAALVDGGFVVAMGVVMIAAQAIL